MALTLHASHADPAGLDTPLLVVILGADASMNDGLSDLDKGVQGALSRSLSRRDFRGARDETMLLVGGDSGIRRVLLVGRGSAALNRAVVRRAAAVATRQAVRLGVGTMHVLLRDAGTDEVEAATIGVAAGAWEYNDLRTPPPENERRAPLTDATVLIADSDSARTAFDAGVAIAEGQAIAKRLGQMPGNYCTPDTFAEVGRAIASRYDMKVTVLGRAEMEREGMGSCLCVAQGTPEEPRLVALEYQGGAPGDRPVVLIGKGLCFDTGGISIKPAPDMEWMKFDMSGAGGVMGAMEAIGRLRPAINVVGIVGSTTNMPSGTAVKPGDVVRASNGKTIEIINTDAEGRLVLADLLVYAKRFNPLVAIDAATLTGAVVIGLGHNAVGVFGSDKAMVDAVLAAGDSAGEPGWPLPLWDEYKDQIKSDVADVRNTGGRAAGAITAALFLKEFVDGFSWVHLDVAGTAYSQTDLGWIPKGPTGTPVGTFVEFVRARAREGAVGGAH
ncbi:MAG: leucyl aminopeptidase [Gemmatimonas sp.]